MSFARMLRLLFRRIPSISRSRRFFRSSRMESPRGSSDRIVVPVASTGYRICPSPSVGLLPINSSRTRPTNDDAATVDSVHRRRPISSLLFNKERSISCSITIRTRNKKKKRTDKFTTMRESGKHHDIGRSLKRQSYM